MAKVSLIILFILAYSLSSTRLLVLRTISQDQVVKLKSEHCGMGVILCSGIGLALVHGINPILLVKGLLMN